MCDNKNCEELVLTDREYWVGPGAAVRILTGLSWFLFGISVATIIGAVLY